MKGVQIMTEYLLTTSNLTKEFDKHTAVDSLNIHLKKGCIYGFIGRNGAGKTTTLKMLSSLSKPTSGEISMFGYIGNDCKKVRNKVGCLIEAPGLYPDMSAFENLKMKCLANGVYSKAYVNDLLEIVGLSDVGAKSTQHFSLGMKQRLGIALALIGEPELLILDEPTNGLDPQGIIEMRNTLSKLNSERNLTILVSSHILEELSKIATDYGIIHDGKLIKEFTAKELSSMSDKRVELTVNSTSDASAVLKNMGINNFKIIDDSNINIYERIDDSTPLLSALIAAGVVISGFSMKSMDLEEFYMNLTGEEN
jgi:ABC-2 type transport system ATP-binding protein